MPACLDFRGLARGHRTPSEQRIIASKVAGSTIISNIFARSGAIRTLGRTAAPSCCFDYPYVRVTFAKRRLPTW